MSYLKISNVILELSDGEEASIYSKNQVFLSPVFKMIDGKWTSAILDIDIRYSPDFEQLFLKNISGCSGKMKLLVRTAFTEA